MHPLSGTIGSISNSAPSGEAGDFTAPYAGEDNNQILIEQANSVSLIRIFRLYGLRIDSQNRKTVCPFKSHKGGRESTPSFWFYPDTNSFYCYGCSIGGKSSHGCEFIATMDSTTRIKAAHKILNSFSGDINEYNVQELGNFSERLEIMMDFSTTVRNFRETYTDEKSNEFIEFCCRVYDQHNLKRDLDNEALRRAVEHLKETISLYTL